jgi:predicted alpha/beta-fold hydrolase
VLSAKRLAGTAPHVSPYNWSLRPFEPFFRNAHLATLAGNYWRRPKSEVRWPAKAVLYQTEPDVQVLVRAQRPDGAPRGELILVHGLEGSSEAGYARSMAHAALEAGYATHRFNMRSCGGTESYAGSNYHSGQTSDLLSVIRERKRLGGLPVYAVGFSLGGNVVLKLAGELGDAARELLAGVCSVSAPIDLAAAVEALDRPENALYQRRFVSRLKQRIRIRHRQYPERFTLDHLPKIRTVYEFDDYYTARLFGFGTADNYYRTQSSNQFLERIRVPALLVVAKDDPLIPFSIYDHPAFSRNPHLRLVAVDHGGHLGFISRRRPRFWLDGVVMEWLAGIGNKESAPLVS